MALLPDEFTKSVHKAGIHVSFRCRPLTKKEKKSNQTVVVRSYEPGCVTLETNPNVNELDIQASNRVTEKVYKCDEYFGPHDDTQAVFEGTAKKLVKPLIAGFNGSVFCYGPTGTGKTFTMFGTDKHPGLIRLLVENLFETHSADFKTTISVAAMELYNNEIRDLLSRKKNNVVNLKTNKKGKALVKGLKRFNANNADEFMAHVNRAISSRITESTGANHQSSRSHCILQVSINQRHITTSVGRISKLNLIDLAGSERVKDTQVKRGPRMDEAVSINKSLLALKQCIRELSQGKKFAPFRDSKLTRILQDALQGGSITYMISCISQGSGQWHATRDTLEYATQARAIKQTKLKRKAPRIDLRDQLKQLRGQFNELHDSKRDLEAELKKLKKQLKQYENVDAIDIDTLEANFKKDMSDLGQKHQLEISQLNNKLHQAGLDMIDKLDTIEVLNKTIEERDKHILCLENIIFRRASAGTSEAEVAVLVDQRPGLLLSIGEDESGSVAEVSFAGHKEFVTRDKVKVDTTQQNHDLNEMERYMTPASFQRPDSGSTESSLRSNIVITPAVSPFDMFADSPTDSPVPVGKKSTFKPSPSDILRIQALQNGFFESAVTAESARNLVKDLYRNESDLETHLRQVEQSMKAEQAKLKYHPSDSPDLIGRAPHYDSLPSVPSGKEVVNANLSLHNSMKAEQKQNQLHRAGADDDSESSILSMDDNNFNDLFSVATLKAFDTPDLIGTNTSKFLQSTMRIRTSRRKRLSETEFEVTEDSVTPDIEVQQSTTVASFDDVIEEIRLGFLDQNSGPQSESVVSTGRIKPMPQPAGVHITEDIEGEGETEEEVLAKEYDTIKIPSVMGAPNFTNIHSEPVPLGGVRSLDDDIERAQSSPMPHTYTLRVFQDRFDLTPIMEHGPDDDLSNSLELKRSARDNLEYESKPMVVLIPTEKVAYEAPKSSDSEDIIDGDTKLPPADLGMFRSQSLSFNHEDEVFEYVHPDALGSLYSLDIPMTPLVNDSLQVKVSEARLPQESQSPISILSSDVAVDTSDNFEIPESDMASTPQMKKLPSSHENRSNDDFNGIMEEIQLSTEQSGARKMTRRPTFTNARGQQKKETLWALHLDDKPNDYLMSEMKENVFLWSIKIHKRNKIKTPLQCAQFIHEMLSVMGFLHDHLADVAKQLNTLGPEYEDVVPTHVIQYLLKLSSAQDKVQVPFPTGGYRDIPLEETTYDVEKMVDTYSWLRNNVCIADVTDENDAKSAYDGMTDILSELMDLLLEIEAQNGHVET